MHCSSPRLCPAHSPGYASPHSYETQLHGGSYPTDEAGSIVTESGLPHLAEQLVPGVQLLRLVCYQLARMDDFANAVQALYEARGDGTGERTEEQARVLREVYHALSAPLDERMRMLHPRLLEPKDDTPYSLEYGRRGQWEHV